MDLIRATKVFPAGSWSHVATDTVVLDFEHRHRRRLRMQGEKGLDFVLDLTAAAALRDGDGLVLEDGRIVAVRAEPEDLTAVTARDAAHLIRLAWHLGNRHLLAQFDDGRVLIRRDHVVEEMLKGLGAGIAHISAPFDPEGGAYDEGHGNHHHDHHHG
jgi:urease accessory protein